MECLAIFFKCFTYYLAMVNCLCLGSKLYNIYDYMQSFISGHDKAEKSVYLTVG